MPEKWEWLPVPKEQFITSSHIDISVRIDTEESISILTIWKILQICKHLNWTAIVITIFIKKSVIEWFPICPQKEVLFVPQKWYNIIIIIRCWRKIAVCLVSCFHNIIQKKYAQILITNNFNAVINLRTNWDTCNFLLVLYSWGVFLQRCNRSKWWVVCHFMNNYECL